MNINELYQVAVRGEKAVENRLFEVLSARFRLLARHKLRDPHEVEEVVQDTMMVIYKEYKEIDFNVSFAAWAYKVLNNRILAHLKKTYRREEKVKQISDDGTDYYFSQDLDLKELRRKLISCLQKIGEANKRYARILNLHRLGFVTEEICQKLNLRRGNFYAILSRARDMLEKCLETGGIR